MEAGLILALVLGGVLLLLVIWFVAAYNGLVRGRNQVREGWAQIDVQLKRRHDLVPNLVETVKGYAAHERGTLEEVIKARQQAVQASGVDAQARAEQGLTGALGRLFALAESYPDLKANTNFLALQEELTSTENKIGFARQYYNEQVMQYNTRREQIPTNIVAGVGNFGPEQFFEIEDHSQREAPKVQF